ncbi:MAG TPA: hypothetical protein VFB38_20335 [Chthonomonadaceae bacterium]|nr:hypothetical protein [Chthonomonadaceae bacterium]
MEVLERTRPYEEFVAVVEAVVRRLQAEGIAALVRIQFYAHSNSTEVGALLTFSDRNQIMQHIQMITDWEEFRQFFQTVKPLDVRTYGKLSEEAEAWIRQFDVVSKTFEEHVAGFVR